MSDNLLIEAIARALFNADAWALNNPEGPRAAAYMPDEFRDLARTALSGLQQYASENFEFADLGGDWVICKKPVDPTPLSDAEKAAVKSHMLRDAVKIVEGRGTHVVVPIVATKEMIRRALPMYPHMIEGSENTFTRNLYAALLSARPRVT